MIIKEELVRKIDEINFALKEFIRSISEFELEQISAQVTSFNSAYNAIKDKDRKNVSTVALLDSAIGSCKRAQLVADKASQEYALDPDQRFLNDHLIEISKDLLGQLETQKLFESSYHDESETSSITTLGADIDELYRNMSALTNQNNQALSDIEERINKLRNEISSTSSDMEGVKTVLRKTFDDADKYINESIERLEEKEQRAEELLELISRDTISGSYQQSAAEERKVANGLRSLSLTFMILMTIVMGITLWESVKETITLQDSVLRLAIVMILSIPAAYLASESSKHRNLETTHHRVSLELKSGDPYISSVQEEKRIAIKESLANRIFLGAYTSDEGTSASISAQELIEKLVEKVSK